MNADRCFTGLSPRALLPGIAMVTIRQQFRNNAVALISLFIAISSLGYNTFDDGSGYTQEDLDGRTAVTSRAAAAASADPPPMPDATGSIL